MFSVLLYREVSICNKQPTVYVHVGPEGTFDSRTLQLASAPQCLP